jgi:hypothetical protein
MTVQVCSMDWKQQLPGMRWEEQVPFLTARWYAWQPSVFCNVGAKYHVSRANKRQMITWEVSCHHLLIDFPLWDKNFLCYLTLLNLQSFSVSKTVFIQTQIISEKSYDLHLCFSDP